MSGIRTLIVDDDPAAVRLHSEYVAATPGFEVIGTARSGAAATALALHDDVDFVLLDMQLPDFSGIEVLHRLRIVRDWDVDVLVVSSARDATTVRQALSAHIVGYLVKPFTEAALRARLEEYRSTRSERAAESHVSLAQGEIDALSRGRDTARARHDPVPLPKGLSESTLSLVAGSLDPTTALSASDVASRCGASLPTVRRYLDHLARTGDATVSHRFGARGRPVVLYRRAAG
jgi:response regulator of citrate/malate metabolism